MLQSHKPNASTKAPIILEARSIPKRFHDGIALQDVDFDLRHGEIHCVMGENSAGKSTLMNILSGVEADYQGAIFEELPCEFDGRHIGIVLLRITCVRQ